MRSTRGCCHQAIRHWWNNTWEVSLNLPVINRRNLNWNIGATWDQTRTYITQLFTSEYVTDCGTSQGTGSCFHITANTA